MVGENGLGNPEFIEYLHLAREKQVQDICKELITGIKNENDSKKTELQDSAGTLLHQSIPLIFIQSGRVELDKAKLFIEFASKISNIQRFMLELCKTCKIRTNSTQSFLLEPHAPAIIQFQEADINNQATIVNSKDDLNVYNQTVENGRNNATYQILNALEGKTPLQKWRRDCMERITSLMITTNGGSKGKLATKIPEVFVEYSYTNEQRSMPQLTIIVKPLKL